MNLDFVFYPQSIAIVGASRKPKSVGNDIVKNLVTQGYKGKVYPVNPRVERLYSLKVYPNLKAIKKKVDLAIVAIPAQYVPDLIKEAGRKAVKAVAVISSGFKETGNSKLEKDLQKNCRQNKISLIGPNCLGIINPEINMNASFACLMPQQGNIAFISQSGALCAAVLDYSKELGLGFSKFISTGNEADIDKLALIKYFSKDPKTKVIAMYVESFSNAPDIIKAVKAITRGDNPKPIIVLKSGRTMAGVQAVASHTGSLSGGDAAYDALFAQNGIIRAMSIRELFEYAQIFSQNKIVKVKDVAVITNAGGPGVLVTDELVNRGLNLASLSANTIKSLSKFLPVGANVNNPIDILGDAKADRFGKALKIVEKDKGVDAVSIILTPQSMTEVQKTAQEIIKVKKYSQKPIIASFMGAQNVKPGVRLMRKANITAPLFPESTASSLAVFGKFAEWSKGGKEEQFFYSDINKQKVKKIFKSAQKNKQKIIPEIQALEILKAYGFPLLKSASVSTADEAQESARKIGKRLAMKIISPDIFHKTDVGGVILNVNPIEAGKKFEAMIKAVSSKEPKAKIEGVLLMEMASKDGLELILGANKNYDLGMLIMFGFGGIYVEVLKDVSFAISPVTKYDAQRMISELKGSSIFQGVRGQPVFDIEKIVDCIGRLSQLLTDFPNIVELDINPLLVLPQDQGARVLDAKIVIE